MKRVSYLLIVPLCVLLSCQKEIPSGNLPFPPSGQIQFSVEEVSTRAQVATKDNMTSMAMFCYKGDAEFDITIATPNHNFNEKITRTDLSSSKGWMYENPEKGKWDKNAKYHSFFAFSPFGAEGWLMASTASDTGFPRASYTVSEDITRQTDLLYATKLNTLNYYMGNRAVALNFRHALSKIDFKASLTPEYTAHNHTVKVKEIVFTELYHSGDVRFGITADTPRPEWGFQGQTAAPYTASVANGALLPSPVLSKTPAAIGASPQFLIPQPIKNRPDGHHPVLKVVYSVTLNGETAARDFTKEYPLTASGLPAQWDPGKGYTYSIAYDGTGLPYGLTCIITDWNDREVPGNPVGTYLHLSTLLALPAPEHPFVVDYSTDGGPVTASSADESIATVSVDADKKQILIHHVAFGSTTITVRVGHLSKKISTGVPPPYLTVDGKRIRVALDILYPKSDGIGYTPVQWHKAIGLQVKYQTALWQSPFMGTEHTGCNAYAEAGESQDQPNGWRLPNTKELLAILDNVQYLETHWTDFKYYKSPGWYWTWEDNTAPEAYGSISYNPGAAVMMVYSEPKQNLRYHFYTKTAVCFVRCIKDL